MVLLQMQTMNRKMGSQRKSCWTSDPRWLLTSILWTTAALVLPALSQDGLSCYYCPLHPQDQPCPNITVKCKSLERCLTSRGRYGRVHMLSQLGCVEARHCGSHYMVPFRGVNYNVSCDCCCSNNCNTQPRATSNLKTILERLHKIIHGGPPEEEDSCANYTSTQTPSALTGTSSNTTGT